ncbi:flagellar basal body-associated protein FliL [Aidingimonas lacisalsi]|uniref:flagellar basal body-associated protein FliL n=1 Tax=Aidingimonas lacisalsi TaxID=2604086 RepID=UPI001F028E84|nr:flagellar basal body-associated protein FliL [Aidingimonas lacisalsi]
MAKKRSGGTRKPWWVLGLLIILLSMGSSAAVYYLLDETSGDTGEQQSEGEQQQEVVAPQPSYIKIEPFTVNLQSDEYDQRLLYVGLSLQVTDEATKRRLKDNMPQVRSRLIMLMSSQNAEALTSPKGKEALTDEVISLFERPIGGSEEPLSVDDVLYTEFIVQ